MIVVFTVDVAIVVVAIVSQIVKLYAQHDTQKKGFLQRDRFAAFVSGLQTSALVSSDATADQYWDSVKSMAPRGSNTGGGGGGDSKTSGASASSTIALGEIIRWVLHVR